MTAGLLQNCGKYGELKLVFALIGFRGKSPLPQQTLLHSECSSWAPKSVKGVEIGTHHSCRDRKIAQEGRGQRF